MKKWYLGAMNDGLFVIDRQPSQSTDYHMHDAPTNSIAQVPFEARLLAEKLIAAHNDSILEALKTKA